MNEITTQTFNFIPKCLETFFVHDVLESYYENDPQEMPSLVNLTYDVIDPIGFQAGGYHETAGGNIDFYTSDFSNMSGDELNRAYRMLFDQLFQGTFDDVLLLAQRYRLSYCILDDKQSIRKNLQHFGVEVW